MDQIPSLPIALDTEEALQRVLADAHALSQEGESGERETYLAGLKERLATTKLYSQQSPFVQPYDDVVTYLEFSIFPFLDGKDQARLVRSRLLHGLAIDVDLKTQFELLFILYGFPAAIAVRQRLLHALLDNEEAIGRGSLTVAGTATPVPPTVKNWVVDFLSATGGPVKPSALELATYYQQSANVRPLTPDQRQQLQQVLALYAFLVAPPILERLRMIRPTQSARLQTAPPGEDFRTTLLRSLFQEAQEEELIFAEEEQLLAGSPYRFDRVAAALHEALAAKTPPRVQAALFLLARSGDLTTLLARDPTLAASVERELLPNVLPELKRQRLELTLETLLTDYRRQPARPAYLLLALRHWLTTAHGGDGAAAARVGARLAGLLLEHGYRDAAHLAFFDAETRQYRWGTIAADSQGVPVLQ